MLRSIRATQRERTCWMPGDGLVLPSIGVITHAITIKATPMEVWPWLVQMGAGRAGWYSYDLLDNGGHPSARRIVPELQHLNLGMLMPSLPKATDGFTVLDFQPESFLILGWVPHGATAPLVSWAFVLTVEKPGCTRLIVRARAGKSYRFFRVPRWMTKAAAGTVHFFMQQKQLWGIARRAEAMSS
jgi:hypothetical protein